MANVLILIIFSWQVPAHEISDRTSVEFVGMFDQNLKSWRLSHVAHPSSIAAAFSPVRILASRVRAGDGETGGIAVKTSVLGNVQVPVKENQVCIVFSAMQSLSSS